MAAAKSIRKLRRNSKELRVKPPKRSSRSAEPPVPDKANERLRLRVACLLVHLDSIGSLLRVIACLLETERTGYDKDMSVVILRQVLDPLYEQMEETEAMLEGRKKVKGE